MEVVRREEGDWDRVGKVNGMKEKKSKKGKEKVVEDNKEELMVAVEGSRETRRLSASKEESTSMRRRVSKSKDMLKKWVSDLH